MRTPLKSNYKLDETLFINDPVTIFAAYPCRQFDLIDQANRANSY